MADPARIQREKSSGDAGDRSVSADAIAAMRRSYEGSGLSESDLAADWPTQFDRWMGDAVDAGLVEPNSMVVATADAHGRPSARFVLLKAVDADGFVFYTHYTSRKGTELTANPRVALVVPWVPLGRQVLVTGRVEKVDEATSDAYFAKRPRGSQLGAAASDQSAVVADRGVLEQAFAALESRYPEPSPVPRPSTWGGFRVVPATIEFWQGRRDRLHDRLRFRRDGEGWAVERLAP